MKKPISGRIEEEILKGSEKVMEIDNRSFNNLLETSLKFYCDFVLKEHAKKKHD